MHGKVFHITGVMGGQAGRAVAPSQIIGGNGNLWAVASGKGGGTTYVTVVNRATSPVTVNVSLAGATGLTSGTATVLTGDPTAMNSIAHPAAVSPVTRPVGHLGPSFRCTFPASSLTVLALHTG